jgi:hypothetical protein
MMLDTGVDTMNYRFKKFFAIIVLLAAVQAFTATEAAAKAAPFSFDSVWFYRDGIKVVPEIGKRWLSVVFDPRYSSNVTDIEPDSDSKDSFIRKKAKAIVKSHDRLIDYLYDPNLAEDACFFRMRDGLKLEDVKSLINQLSQDGTVKYVHPTLLLDNKTFAFFNLFQMEWKTGADMAERESLLRASHAAVDEFDAKGTRYIVDVRAMPFFRALNLLAEDIKVLRVTPYLVEVTPSISTKLSLFMSGGNIGDSIPFTLTIAFSDRVNIDPSSIATLNLRPPEIQKELFDCTFDPYDYAKAVTKSPITITGRVKFYAPGEYTIPAVTISYSCPSCSDSTVRLIATEPLLFKVSSIIPTDKSKYRLIVPTDPVAPEYRPAALIKQYLRFQWLAIICLAGLVLCAAWLLILLYKVTAERNRLKERKRNGQLAEQLTTLLHATPTAPHWSYLGEVGALLRGYLLVLHGIDLKYRGGSGRQFMETIRAHVPPECLGSLSSIFIAIDNSVALETEHYKDIDQLRSEILKVVDSKAQNSAAHG